jgi:hypothetical protein
VPIGSPGAGRRDGFGLRPLIAGGGAAVIADLVAEARRDGDGLH